MGMRDGEVLSASMTPDVNSGVSMTALSAFANLFCEEIDG